MNLTLMSQSEPGWFAIFTLLSVFLAYALWQDISARLARVMPDHFEWITPSICLSLALAAVFGGETLFYVMTLCLLGWLLLVMFGELKNVAVDAASASPFRLVCYIVCFGFVGIAVLLNGAG